MWRRTLRAFELDSSRTISFHVSETSLASMRLWIVLWPCSRFNLSFVSVNFTFQTTSGRLEVVVQGDTLFSMQGGARFLKVRSKLCSRMYSLSSDFRKIRWHSRYKAPNEACIPTSTIRDVMCEMYPRPTLTPLIERDTNPPASKWLSMMRLRV